MNYPQVLSKFYWADAQTVQIKRHTLYPLLDVAVISVLRSLVLFFTISMGVALTTLLGASFDTTIAQTPTETRNGEQLGVKTMNQVNILFVNPSIGDDRSGNGSESTPFKTITQALQVASPNTVIMLSQGNYSTETGEKFPLILKPNISIQGDTRSKGRGIVIQGGGNYLSRSFGGQNVLIVGADKAELTGVTLTNPNPRGYGLWIEYSSPLVVENTFTGNTQDGIAVTGSATPIIRNNFFYQNGANGMTISGSARPEVRENVFQQTGFGINIAQNAQPIIVGNQIQYNRSGIVVQANARPILRNNLIQGSKEDGLVALALAIPNLGITSEPGGNEFRNNARYDINATAAKQVFPVFGNKINQNRIAGKVDIDTVASSSLPVSPLPSRGYRRQTSPQIVTRQPVPLPALTTQLAQSRANTSQSNYTQISPDTIEFTAPQLANNEVGTPVPRVRNQAQSLPVLEASPTGASALLPVPDSNIPIGNSRNNRRRKATVPQSSVATSRVEDPSLLSTPEGQINLRYRVFVEVQNDRDLELVKFLAPGSFQTVWRGREVMQAGIFGSRYNADSMVKIFNNNGLKAVIEPIN